MTANPAEVPTRTPEHPRGTCTRRPGAKDTGCRCSAACTALSSRARQERKKREARGVPGRVPTTAVKRRIRAYLAHDPSRNVSDLAALIGVSRRTLMVIFDSGPERTMRLDLARKILDVDPAGPWAAGNGSVPSLEARRQVEALMVQGWSVKVVAEKAGVSASALSRPALLPTCHPKTAQGVARVFADLRYKTGPSQGTRTRAIRGGYLPWVGWEGRMAVVEAQPNLNGLDPQWAAAYRARTDDAR